MSIGVNSWREALDDEEEWLDAPSIYRAWVVNRSISNEMAEEGARLVLPDGYDVGELVVCGQSLRSEL